LIDYAKARVRRKSNAPPIERGEPRIRRNINIVKRKGEGI